MGLFNPLSTSVALNANANQLTGFYMRATLALNGLRDEGRLYKVLWSFLSTPFIIKLKSVALSKS